MSSYPKIFYFFGLLSPICFKCGVQVGFAQKCVQKKSSNIIKI